MPSAPQTERSGRVAKVRRAMYNITFEGMFASASDNFAAPLISLFALTLGASKTQIGLIAALTALGANLLQLPLAAITKRFWQRKNWCILSGILARGLWLPIALLPFYASGSWAIELYITLLAIRALASALGVPAWTALVADIVPQRLRGTFFAHRNALFFGGQVAAMLIVGWVIRCWSAPAGYQIAFALAFICGLAAVVTFAYLKVPDRAIGQSASIKVQQCTPTSLMANLRTVLTEVPKQKLFATYAAVSAIWSLGVTLPQPFFSVYFVSQLHGPEHMWTIVASIEIGFLLIGQRYWGPLVDRFGAHRIMTISGIGASSVPLFWWLAPSWGYLCLFNIISGFLWAGYNLGAFNLLLQATPRSQRAMYVALYNGIIGISAAIAPLAGGVIADYTSIRLVLLLSWLLRSTGWLLLSYIVHPPAGRSMRPADLLPNSLRLRHKKVAKR